jgi:hypothetical protein
VIREAAIKVQAGWWGTRRSGGGSVVDVDTEGDGKAADSVARVTARRSARGFRRAKVTAGGRGECSAGRPSPSPAPSPSCCARCARRTQQRGDGGPRGQSRTTLPVRRAVRCSSAALCTPWTLSALESPMLQLAQGGELGSVVGVCHSSWPLHVLSPPSPYEAARPPRTLAHAAAMDVALDGVFSRVETAFATLVDSIAAYNPSLQAAGALIAADDELARGIDKRN